MFFEVPLLETDPLFTGRYWFLQELHNLIDGSCPGVLLSGSPGTGKTALILQLVDYSCFGRKRGKNTSRPDLQEPDLIEELDAAMTAKMDNEKTNEKVNFFVRLQKKIIDY